MPLVLQRAVLAHAVSLAACAPRVVGYDDDVDNDGSTSSAATNDESTGTSGATTGETSDETGSLSDFVPKLDTETRRNSINSIR